MGIMAALAVSFLDGPMNMFFLPDVKFMTFVAEIGHRIRFHKVQMVRTVGRMTSVTVSLVDRIVHVFTFIFAIVAGIT